MFVTHPTHCPHVRPPPLPLQLPPWAAPLLSSEGEEFTKIDTVSIPIWYSTIRQYIAMNWAFGQSRIPLHENKGKRTHCILLLLSPAVAVITLGVGFHGHGGEEILHGVVAKIITDTPKL